MISIVFGPPRKVSRLDTTGSGGVQLNVSPGVAMTSAFLYPFLNFAAILLILRGKVGDEAIARVVYQVAEVGGNHFLHARSDKQDVQIGLSRVFQPKEFPLLRWRWRVDQLPSGGNERAAKTNDSAVAVYVIFDSRIIPRVIKYVWSATLLVGTYVDSPVYWRAKVAVLRSGASGLREWRQETVNFYQDYKDLFGTEPGEVQGIAVLT